MVAIAATHAYPNCYITQYMSNFIRPELGINAISASPVNEGNQFTRNSHHLHRKY